MLFLYLVLLIITLLFYILYEGLISLLIFVFTLSLPFFIIFANIYTRKRVNAEINTNSKTVAAEEKVITQIAITNNSSFPVLCCEITLEFKTAFSQTAETIKINTSLFPKNTEKLTMSFNAEHYGFVNCRIKKIKIFDMLKMTSLKLKQNQYTQREDYAVIMPEPLELTNQITDYSCYSMESDTFSDTKPGDDPSEIFSIREYNAGDKLNKIHWKLTAKENKLIVKEYSLPLTDSFLIITDTYTGTINEQTKADIYDAVILTSVSLSKLLNDNCVRHKASAFNSKLDSLITKTIFDEETCYQWFSELLNCGCSKTDDSVISHAINTFATPRQFTHVVYICSRINQKLINSLESTEAGYKYTLLLCCEDDYTYTDISSDTNTEIIKIRSSDLQNSLSEIVL